MRKTTLLIPLAASLMLGTAAYAQYAPQNAPQNTPMSQPTANPAPPSDQSQTQPADQSSQPMNAQPQNAQPMGAQSMNTAATDQANGVQSTNGGMPIDQETSVNGIQAACTGVGDQQENNARWRQYPVKVVVSGTGHQFFAGETVSVTKSDGTQVAQMTCNAPWVLMKLDPGSYHATVDLPGHPTKTVAFNAPSRGQREVNVVYTGAQEASDQTSTPADQHRATETNYQEPTASPAQTPTAAPAPSSTQQPMNEQDMKSAPQQDQSPNNSDQPPQPK